MTYRYENVLGTPGEAPRGSARQQIYASLRGTDQNLNLLGETHLVGITAPTGNMVSCNMLAERLSQMVLEQLKKEGILGLSAPITGVSDGVLNGHPNMGFSLHSRNEMAGQIGFSSDQYRPDGHIGIFACDKTGPAEAMGYAALKDNAEAERGTVPAVMMYAGSTVPGFCHLSEKKRGALKQRLVEAGILESTHDIVTGFKIEPAITRGIISAEEGEEILRHTVEEIGACQGMYTANTMSVSLEVLGMTPPESSLQITTDDRINFMVQRTVDCMKICLQKGITPRKIITEKSIRNAMAIVNALGGSTNAVLHYIAIGKRLDINLPNEFFREVRENTPLVGNVKPFGTGDMVDYIRNGDHKTLLKSMIEKGMIDGSLPTVSGRSLGDNVDNMEVRQSTGKTTLYSFSQPINSEGNIVILNGNICTHAVMKVTAEPEKYFKGKAICFNSEQDAIQGILDGKVEDGMVVVIRFVGPKAAGMPEMLTPTSLIKAKNIKCALISDGRFSGGSYGSVVGHITPEAAIGGYIARIEDGDEIEINSRDNTLNVNGVDLENRIPATWLDKRDDYDPLKIKHTLIQQAADGADYKSPI